MGTFLHPATNKAFLANALHISAHNWHIALQVASDMGSGWRLPTIDELEAIYEQLHKAKSKEFAKTIYWSSSEFSDDAAWYFDFSKGMDGTGIKILAAFVIAVKEADTTISESESTELIIFGDIHGHHKAAEYAIGLAEELSLRALFLGDYVDRGPSSIETLSLMIKAKQRHPGWTFLRGNHDHMLLDLAEGRAKPDDVSDVLEGTSFSYSQAKATYHEWNSLTVKKKNEIVKFLKNTILFYETEAWVFSHAVLRNTNQEVKDKSKDELIWNYEYIPYWEGKSFVHGHLPVDCVKFVGKGININTKCGYGGFLTGLIIDIASGDHYKTFKFSENGEILN